MDNKLLYDHLIYHNIDYFQVCIVVLIHVDIYVYIYYLGLPTFLQLYTYIYPCTHTHTHVMHILYVCVSLALFPVLHWLSEVCVRCFNPFNADMFPLLPVVSVAHTHTVNCFS